MKRLLLVLLILLLPFKNAQADLKSAYEALQSKNYEFALSQLSGVKSSSLQDYIFWIHGKSSLELGRLDDAIRAFEQLMTQDPRSLFVDDARAGLAKAWYQKSNFEKVRSLMMGSLSKFEDASKKEKGEALYYAGLAELQLGDSNKALAYLKESYLQNPNPEISKELSAKLSELGVQLNATDLLKRADQYFNSKSYSEAIRAYEAVVSGEEARVASVKKGEALYQLKKCSEALPYLTNTASGLSIELARLVLLHRGICQQKVQDTSQAQMTFERVQQLYPSTLEGEEALYRLGDMALNSGNATQAFSYFQSLSDQYPHGNFRDKGMWAAAWKAYETQDFDRAKKFLSSLENGAQDFPTKGKAIYWLGKVALKQKNEKLAKSEWERASEISPFSYYGFMALKKNQGSTEISKTPQVPSSWKMSAMLPSSGEVGSDFHLLKAVALYEAGMGKFTTPELLAALRENESKPAGLAQLLKTAQKTNAWFIPVAFGQRYWDKFKLIFPDEKSAEAFRATFQFPDAFKSDVQKASQEFGVPATLIRGLMRQESAFQPWIVSSANAQGLMQMLPSTAKMRAKAIGESLGDLFNSSYNIRLGTAELKFLLNRFNNNWVYAIAGYNAGPGRPPQWDSQFGNLELDEFIEEIPFSETNLYVKLVLRNHWSYQTLY